MEVCLSGKTDKFFPADTADTTWKSATDINVFSKFLYFWVLPIIKYGDMNGEKVDSLFPKDGSPMKMLIFLMPFLCHRWKCICSFEKWRDFEVSSRRVQAYEVKELLEFCRELKILPQMNSVLSFVLDPGEKRIFIYESTKTRRSTKRQIVFGKYGTPLDLYVLGNTLMF